MTKQRVLDDDIVLQHSEKVVKPDDEMHNDQRFDALESQINQLKSLLLLNEGEILHKIKKEGEPNGLGRIRTSDLRRVNKEVDRRSFHPCQIAAKRLLERQAPLRALFDRYSFAVLQALRT